MGLRELCAPLAACGLFLSASRRSWPAGATSGGSYFPLPLARLVLPSWSSAGGQLISAKVSIFQPAPAELAGSTQSGAGQTMAGNPLLARRRSTYSRIERARGETRPSGGRPAGSSGGHVTAGARCAHLAPPPPTGRPRRSRECKINSQSAAFARPNSASPAVEPLVVAAADTRRFRPGRRLSKSNSNNK